MQVARGEFEAINRNPVDIDVERFETLKQFATLRNVHLDIILQLHFDLAPDLSVRNRKFRDEWFDTIVHLHRCQTVRGRNNERRSCRCVMIMVEAWAAVRYCDLCLSAKVLNVIQCKPQNCVRFSFWIVHKSRRVVFIDLRKGNVF